ncbi:hypothetical protein [Rheinheimera sp. MMS21-TC3]|uniref:hypothetical protein n=1 Tax=Rheinheimera sp. MMS21-TC3 TaxID=3072790 RepID=UPI0028C392FA|nr:hypothetical protein [Rheinheimera sp. MMS21-TC3]WNO61328.1 hypothetical protein RDV63_10295 [Rheinheimera sp. MMS21-TC3]
MKTFNVTMKFDLYENNVSLDNIDNLLFEAGFDDALVSHSSTGQIEIEISRSAETEDTVKESITRQVRRLFPNAKSLN